MSVFTVWWAPGVVSGSGTWSLELTKSSGSPFSVTRQCFTARFQTIRVLTLDFGISTPQQHSLSDVFQRRQQHGRFDGHRQVQVDSALRRRTSSQLSQCSDLNHSGRPFLRRSPSGVLEILDEHISNVFPHGVAIARVVSVSQYFNVQRHIFAIPHCHSLFFRFPRWHADDLLS